MEQDNDKIFPLNLSKPTDKLKELIKKYPYYPIVVLAGENASCGFWWTYCSSLKFEVTEMLECKVPYEDDNIVCNSRDEFNDNLADWLWDKLGGCENPPKIDQKEFEKRLANEKQKYEPYWKKVIAIYADN